jgi:hypothetical protein
MTPGVFSGDNAIVQMGTTDGIDGTNGEQPRGTLIEGNLIHELGYAVCGAASCA